jgi:hypothetical protein
MSLLSVTHFSYQVLFIDWLYISVRSLRKSAHLVSALAERVGTGQNLRKPPISEHRHRAQLETPKGEASGYTYYALDLAPHSLTTSLESLGPLVQGSGIALRGERSCLSLLLSFEYVKSFLSPKNSSPASTLNTASSGSVGGPSPDVDSLSSPLECDCRCVSHASSEFRFPICLG